MFFRSTDEANKVSMETKNLGTLASGIANMFAGQGNYSGLSNAVLLTSNAIPASMKGASAGTIRHAWNPAGVTVAATDIAPPADNDSFAITYAGVPSKSCVDLASKTIAAFQSLSIGGTAVTNMGEISTQCSKATTATMTWVR